MANEELNVITITDKFIEFKGFPLLKGNEFSVFHAADSFTIYPFKKEAPFHTNFSIINGKIEAGTRDYAIFKTILEEKTSSKRCIFTEINGVYMIML